MVDLGFNIKLTGTNAFVSTLRSMFNRVAGLAGRKVDTGISEEVGRTNDGLERQIKLQERLNRQRKRQADPRQEQFALGRQFGGALSNEITREAKKLGAATGDTTGKVKSLDLAMRAQNHTMQDAIVSFKVYLANMSRSKAPLTEQAAGLKNVNAAVTSTIGVLKKLIAQNQKLAGASAGLTKEQKKQLAALEALQGAFQKNQGTIARVIKRQREFNRTTQAGAKDVNKLNERIAIAIGKLLRYRIAFFIIRKIIDSVRKSIQTFIDVQDGLAQLNKVINPIQTNMEELQKIGFKFAKAYAVGVNEVVDAFKRWAQTGLEQQEIIEATQATLLAANAVNLESKEVVEALTSAIFAYGVETRDVTEVVDKWIAVQAKFPVVAKDLLQGLQTIGVVAKDFGVTIDELNGQIAAISAVTRKSGKAVAQSLKTIFARIPRVRTIKAFQDVGVAVLGLGGKVRRFNDIMEDLSQVWGRLTEVQRKNIAQTTGGIRRYVDFVALLNNFSVAQQATAVSVGSAGAAFRAANIQISTFKSNIDRTKAAFEELGFTLGEQLSRPLSLFLSIISDLAGTFAALNPIFIQITAAFITFIGTFLTILVATKAVTFSLGFLKNALYGTSTAALTLAESEHLVDLAGKKLATTHAGLVVSQESLKASTVGTAAAFGALASRMNIIIGVISLVATAFAFLSFKTKEYKEIIDDTTKSVGSQARALFKQTLGFINREKIFFKALEDRRLALLALIKLEGKTSPKANAKRKIELQNLLAANKVIAAESRNADVLLSRKREQSFKAQLLIHRQLIALSDEIVAGFKEQKTGVQDIFEILQKQRPLLERQLTSAIKAQSAIADLSGEVDTIFRSSRSSAKRFGETVKELEFPKDFAWEADRVMAIFEKADVGNLGDLLETPKTVTSTLKDVRNVLDEAGTAIGEFNKDVEQYKAAIKSKVPAGLFTSLEKELNNLSATNKATLEGATTQVEKFIGQFKRGDIAPLEFQEQTINQLARLSSILSDSDNIASQLLAPALGKVNSQVSDLTFSIAQLDFANTIAGAKDLEDAVEKVTKKFQKFFGTDVSKKYIEDFNKIRLAVRDASAQIEQSLSLKGIERDSRKALSSLQAAYVGQINNLRTLAHNLQAEIAKVREEFIEAVALSKDARVFQEDQAKFRDKAILLETKLNNLLAQQLVSKELISWQEAELIKKLEKVNRFLERENVLQAARANSLSTISLAYATQANLAKALGLREDVILGIERERIAAIGKQKIAQLALIEDTNTINRILKQTNKTMIDLAENAQEVSLIQVERQLERINNLTSSLEGTLSSAFSGVTADFAKGVEERFRVSEEIREAEFELQEAIKKGDEEAAKSAALRITELKKELDTFKVVLFEVREFGRKIFEGIGESINNALSEKFAEDIVELAVDDATLGQKISKAILDAGEVNVENLKALDRARLSAVAGVDKAFLTELGITLKDGNLNLSESIADVLRAADLPDRMAAVFDAASVNMKDKVIEAIIEGFDAVSLSRNQEAVKKGVEAALTGQESSGDNTEVVNAVDAQTNEIQVSQNALIALSTRGTEVARSQKDAIVQTTSAVEAVDQSVGSLKGTMVKVIDSNSTIADAVSDSTSSIVTKLDTISIGKEFPDALKQSIASLPIDALGQSITEQGNTIGAAISTGIENLPIPDLRGAIDDSSLPSIGDRIVDVIIDLTRSFAYNLNSLDSTIIANLRGVSTGTGEITEGLSTLASELATEMTPGFAAIQQGVLQLATDQRSTETAIRESAAITGTETAKALSTIDLNSDTMTEAFRDGIFSSGVITTIEEAAIDPVSFSRLISDAIAGAKFGEEGLGILKAQNEAAATQITAENNRIIAALQAQGLMPTHEELIDPEVAERLRLQNERTEALRLVTIQLQLEQGATHAQLVELGLIADDQIEVIKTGHDRIATAVEEGNILIEAASKKNSKDLVDWQQVLDSGLDYLGSTLASTIGGALGGGTKAAIGGAATGFAFGKMTGNPLVAIGAAILGGIAGGLFGGKEEPKKFIPAVEENTEALRNNTIAIEQLQRNVINAPSNFNIPNTTLAAQSPAPQFNIRVSGVTNPDQFVDQVINRISRDYQRGLRTGGTRRSAL